MIALRKVPREFLHPRRVDEDLVDEGRPGSRIGVDGAGRLRSPSLKCLNGAAH